jgi:hypothetical protein
MTTNNPSVEIAEITNDIPITTGCVFCEKTVSIYKEEYDQTRSIGHGHYFCPFCIRNGHHHQDAILHTLPLSFRGVIGYYYWQLYINPSRAIYLSEIESCIREHVQMGLQHPAFSYDPETLNWYINFRLIGKTKHKLPLKTVHDNIDFILETFGIKKRVPQLNVQMFQEKFNKAITLYYEQRQRPKEKKLLCPTFVNCGTFRHDMDFESIKTLPNFFFDSYMAGENSVNTVAINEHEEGVKAREEVAPKIIATIKEKDASFEAMIAVPGLKTTKLERSDGNTIYPTKASLTSGLRSLERKMGIKVEVIWPKIAAK